MYWYDPYILLPVLRPVSVSPQDAIVRARAVEGDQPRRQDSRAPSIFQWAVHVMAMEQLRAAVDAVVAEECLLVMKAAEFIGKEQKTHRPRVRDGQSESFSGGGPCRRGRIHRKRYVYRERGVVL